MSFFTCWRPWLVSLYVYIIIALPFIPCYCHGHLVYGWHPYIGGLCTLMRELFIMRMAYFIIFYTWHHWLKHTVAYYCKSSKWIGVYPISLPAHWVVPADQVWFTSNSPHIFHYVSDFCFTQPYISIVRGRGHGSQLYSSHFMRLSPEPGIIIDSGYFHCYFFSYIGLLLVGIHGRKHGSRSFSCALAWIPTGYEETIMRGCSHGILFYYVSTIFGFQVLFHYMIAHINSPSI